ncbi:MAG: hypothetical protein KDC10_11450 [Calditrichaeota bacterium]|nr:hypothetical protein [Calditrichota bacterium]
MKFGSSRARRSFGYTPFFLKEPPKELRERLKFRRSSGLEDRARSARRWLLVAVASLLLIWYLFPEVVSSFWLDSVQIGSEDLQLHE